MGTHYQVVDDNEIELDDEAPTMNESWNKSAIRGGHGIGMTMMQSWCVLQVFIHILFITYCRSDR